METSDKKLITIEATIEAPRDIVWKKFTTPEDIIKWNNASDDWHTTKAENDLKAGGKFSSRMEAKNGSFGFDFFGIYDDVKTNELISYTLGDGRKVAIYFNDEDDVTKVVETFEAESTHSLEQQQTGWQSILNNFKKYVEDVA